jgi:hypothetical protein
MELGLLERLNRSHQDSRSADLAINARIRSFETAFGMQQAAPEAFAELQDILASGGLYVFTINGFPYGPFHGTRVKEEVYQPDWRTPERLAYSNLLADQLVRLLPDDPDLDGSISTVPGGFKPDCADPATITAMADNLLAHAAHLVQIRRDTGRTIAWRWSPNPIACWKPRKRRWICSRIICSTATPLRNWPA